MEQFCTSWSRKSFSRSVAKNTLDFEKVQKDMEGIVSSSVSMSTLDECPMFIKMQKLLKLQLVRLQI